MRDYEASVQSTVAEAALADEHEPHEMLQLSVVLLYETAAPIETAAPTPITLVVRGPFKIKSCSTI